MLLNINRVRLSPRFFKKAFPFTWLKNFSVMKASRQPRSTATSGRKVLRTRWVCLNWSCSTFEKSEILQKFCWFFGLGKKREVRWLEMYQTQNTELVKKCFRLQFEREYGKLYSELNRLEKFGEMEAKTDRWTATTLCIAHHGRDFKWYFVIR